MIVCSCNVLSEADILAAMGSGSVRPGSPLDAYRCLGCAPRCGRCLKTVRALLAEAHIANCHVGCSACPAAERNAEEAHEQPTRWLIAAE